MLMPSISETDCNCPPPPSAPHLFLSFSCGKLILLLFFSWCTALHKSVYYTGRLEITRLLVESKADVAARAWCFSPPPSHHLSLTICLAAMAKLHSIWPSPTTKPTLLHTCAASARPNIIRAPPRCPPCLLRASARRNKCCSCSRRRRSLAARRRRRGSRPRAAGAA